MSLNPASVVGQGDFEPFVATSIRVNSVPHAGSVKLGSYDSLLPFVSSDGFCEMTPGGDSAGSIVHNGDVARPARKARPLHQRGQWRWRRQRQSRANTSRGKAARNRFHANSAASHNARRAFEDAGAFRLWIWSRQHERTKARFRMRLGSRGMNCWARR